MRKKFISMICVICFILSMGISVQAATYLWPTPGLTNANITQYYSSSHMGLDIAAQGDNKVVAAREGTVIAAASTSCKHNGNKDFVHSTSSPTCNYGMGNYVQIKHSDGTYATYMHLRYGTVCVSKGQYVSRGDEIGIMGNSGNCYGSVNSEYYGQHLHFQVGYSSTNTINVNPSVLGYDYSTQSTTQYTDLGDNFYATINHVTNGHAVGINKTGLLELVDKKVTEKNRWHFVRQADGSYMIYLNVGSQVMDVQNAGTSDGTRVGLSNANYGTAQKWYIYKKDNTYYFKTQSSNMVLDVGNNHGEIGDWIQMWTPNQSQAQYFTINNVVPFNEWIYIHNQSETPVLYSDEDVIFTYDAVTASYYDLWLYKDKQQVGQMYAGTSKTYSKRLSAGNYEVLFASQNNVGWNYGSFHPFVVIDRYYTIQFDANGGTCNQASKTVTHNTAYGALPTPTKNGYRFNGWYTEAGGGTKVTSDTIVTITANQTLYAQWVEDKYTLQVSPMGGTWNDFDTTQSYKLSYQETKELPVPYREGYTFASWELDFEGEGHEISGSGTSDFNQVRGIPLIKDPSFKESLGQFSLYNNTANGSVTHTRIEKEDGLQTGSSYMMKITSSGEAHPGLGGFRQITPSKANGIFYHVIIAKIPKGYYIQQANNDCGTGWNYEWLTSREGTGNWETYIYKFNCGASGTFSTLGHIFITSDKDMWWPDVYGETTNTPITWYVGYSEILDATNTNTASSLYTMGNGNASLYALWIPNTYTISFDTNGGNPLNETKTVVYDSKYNTLPLPQKTGFKFAGWFTEPDGGIEITSDTIVSNAINHKLYARWKSTEPHTLTTVHNGKFIIEPNNIEIDSVVMLALYKNQKFVKLYNATYEGKDIPFTVTEDYDEAKVMVWKDLNTLKPITAVEIVK